MELTRMIMDRHERRTFLVASLGITCGIATRAVASLSSSTVVADEVIQMVPKRLDGNAPVVTAISLHPAGQWIAAGGDDHIVRIWDRTRGTVIRELNRHRDWVRAILFSPAGDSIATAGADGMVYLWDRMIDSPQMPALQRPNPLNALAYTPDGQYLVVVGFRCELLLFEISSRQIHDTWPCPCLDMRSVAVSPNNKWIAAGGRNGIVRVWDRETHRKLIDIAAHKQRIRTVLFDATGERLMTAGEDRMIYTFDLRSGKQIHTVTNDSAKILSLALVGSNHVAAAGSDNIIRIFDLDNGQLMLELTGHTGSVAALSRQNDLLVSGSYDTTVRVWNVAALNGTPQRAALPDQGPTDSPAMSEVR